MIEGIAPDIDNIMGGLFFGLILAIPIFWLFRCLRLIPYNQNIELTPIDIFFDDSNGDSYFYVFNLIISLILMLFIGPYALVMAIVCVIFQGTIKRLLNYIFYAKV
ncbi:hypothetical protein [Campylobacter showae]|uniref:hypothetical protein n=1 Tax=Campylobacter showae TaxID=204 RepID=UPI0003496A95|nr:hypothetical protein [Campylobacter showae]